jgi:hypothetical protein
MYIPYSNHNGINIYSITKITARHLFPVFEEDAKVIKTIIMQTLIVHTKILSERGASV